MIAKEALQEGMDIENMAAPGKFLNVKGNRKRNGARIQLWDNRTSAGTQWLIKHVAAKAATYMIESASAPGMYLTVVEDNDTTIQLLDNASVDNALWRVQNVEGNV